MTQDVKLDNSFSCMLPVDKKYGNCAMFYEKDGNTVLMHTPNEANVSLPEIAMGADANQTMKALSEAEAYPGPSIVIAYAPCEMHGVKGGMANSQVEMKRAVEAGYWQMFRYNPALKAEGKNPFILDSKEPTGTVKEFLEGENRYLMLKKAFPEVAAQLFDKAEKDLLERYEIYKKKAAEEC
jgi:pyruvate-ferredoxin/flavodoxin oxidoreductase